MHLWKCCTRTYSQNIKKCRVCGILAKRYGVIEDKPKPAKTPQSPRAAKETPQKRKRRTGPDPHIGPDDRPAVSTLKMQPGYEPARKKAKNT